MVVGMMACRNARPGSEDEKLAIEGEIARNKIIASDGLFLQHISHFLRKAIKRKWLDDQMNTLVQASMMHNCISRIACCEKGLNFRSNEFGLSHHISACHAAGQNDVGKCHINTSGCLEQNHGRWPVRSFENLVSQLTE